MVAASELSIDRNASAAEMAQEIFGDGVTIVSASYDGDNRSSGIYSGGDSTSPGVVPADTGVILSTGRVDDFTNNRGDANQSSSTSTNTRGDSNNAQFNAAAGARTYDASYMDVDFIPTGDTMTMRFVFASEEYPEFTTSQYQDFVGVWVNGTQVDIVPGDGDIDPSNLNSSTNSNLFVDNTNDAYNTEMDGFTVTMTMTMNVNPGVVNSIRIGIADVLDSSYDSNLLIAGGSGQTTLIAEHDTAEVYPAGTEVIDVLANDQNNSGGTLTITHINGVAVTPGDSVVLNSGQTVTLNADGTLSFTGDGDLETVNFTYGVESSTGATDTGFVTVATVPCFVAGTAIRCEGGSRRVEELRPGDRVWTLDSGFQPLRWIGLREVAAVGRFAPVRIRAGTFGDHADLLVSPQHRVLIRDPLADLAFGTSEVLVAAKHLVDGDAVQIREGGSVTYVHLLFDKHEILLSNGLTTESFLPGPQTACAFERETAREIAELFPELDLETGNGYGLAARQVLRRHEARLFARSAA